MTPRSSVIIPCRDDQRLQATLQSLLNTVDIRDVEVIVVDDGSTDGCCDDLPVGVRRVKTRGIGCANAKNTGAELARGHILAFCDAHMTFDDGWYNQLTDILARTQEAGVVVPTVAAHDNGDAAGCGMAFVSDFPVPQFALQWLHLDESSVVPIGCGMCHLWRADTFRRIGGFNAEMAPWGGEDIEISIRAALLGYAVIGVPESRVKHVFQESFRPGFDVRYAVANDLRVALIHFNAIRVARILNSLADQWPADDFAFIYEYACTPETLRTRRCLQTERVVDDTTWFEMHDHFGVG